MNIPSIESLYATIEQQQRVIKQAHEDIAKLTAERDEWEANSGQWEQEYYKASAERDRFANMISESSNRWQEMMAALREAKEALVMNIVGTGGRTPATHNAIATINKVLGEE